MDTKIITNGYHNGHPEILSINDLLLNDSKMKLKDVNLNSKTRQEQQPENKYLNGPNQILPATEYNCTDPDGCVKLRLVEKGCGAEPPISVPGLLNRTVIRYPDTMAMVIKNADGTWEKITYREYQQLIFTCAKAFLKLGLEKFHSVAILGFNSAEWFISDLAAIHAGGIAVGIYTTNSAEACHHVLLNSRANIAIVQDDKQMEKVRSVWHRLPKLKAVIQWEGQPKAPLDNIYTWKELMKIGKMETNAKLSEALKSIAINQCCTLVYTSGTVGQPKGTMLSHDNMVWEAHAITKRIDLRPGEEVIVSYLPLSHVAAQMTDIYMSMMNAITIYFGDKDALKGSLVKTLQEAQPTCFIGVPRVWEKMHEKMCSVAASSGTVKKFLGDWAKKQSLNYYSDLIKGTNNQSQSFKLARMLVFNRVKTALGFNHCRLYVTAAAPLSNDVKKYFLSLDIPIMDVFGMSELSGAHSLSVLSAFNLDSVGRPLDGVETKFDNEDPATGDGELCIRGRHAFMGYLEDPKKTNEAVDNDGWLRSGDIGKLDSKGHLYITGRLKELLITAGGENVAPVIIEQQLKIALPVLSQAMVIGDRRKFLSVLLAFKTEVDMETGTPLDKLSTETLKWVEKLGSSIKTVNELMNTKDEKILKAIQNGIDKANGHAISNAQKIQKFTILPCDFSIITGELGPTLKIKRNVVMAKYEDIIEKMYV